MGWFEIIKPINILLTYFIKGPTSVCAIGGKQRARKNRELISPPTARLGHTDTVLISA